MKHTYWLLAYLLLFTTTAHAYFDKDIRILTMQNGLADNTVYCIHKDRDGFMWFGTNNGLSRYDGKTIRNFSMPDTYLTVSHIRETTNDLLWLITSDNLMCFDRKTERLLPVETSGWWKDVVFTDNSTLWALSNQALVHCRIELIQDHTGTAQIKLHEIKRIDTFCQPDTSLSAICSSGDGLLYLVDNAGYIFTFDTRKEEITATHRVFEQSNLQVQRILYASGLLWISTIEFGAIVYNTATGDSRRYTHNLKPTRTSTSHHDSYQIIALPDGRFLSATWNGYTVFNPTGKNATDFTTEIYNNTTSHTLRNMESRMLCAHYDPAGMFWVGTRGGGVYASDLRLQFYTRYHQDTHNEICGIATDADGYIWLAGFHSGVMRSGEPFHPQAKLHFDAVAPQAGETVLTVAVDAHNNLWFAGRNKMLTCYRADTRSYVSYPVLPEGENAWSGDIWTLYLNSPGKIWIGSTNGLLVFDLATKKFNRIQGAFGAIRAIASTSKDYLWLGTSNGLMKFSLTEKKITGKAYEERKGLNTREVRTLLAASDNYLYVGYSAGLGIVDPATNEIEHFYTTRDGLCSNFFGCITEDAAGDIWLGTNSGITRFSRTQQLFYNYYISSSNRSSWHYNGYLFWGNNLNLTCFHSENVKSLHDTPSRVRITQLEVDGKPVKIGEKINKQVLLHQGTTYTDNLTLNQQNNSISLSFSNLTFSEELQKYRYRLTPFHGDWLVVSEGEKATYTNLPKGNYLFEVSSIYPNGQPGETTSLQIKILPHWYETTLSRFIFFCTLALITLWIILWSRRKQKRLAWEERLKHELELANVERDKEKQINRERENFFTNVSHELRTPLTLILSPLQELLQTEQIAPDIQEKLELMHRSATSLSTLMNQLLYVQKIEAGMVKLHPMQTDIIELVHKTMALFEPLARMKQIVYSFDTDSESMYLWIDAAKIESALTNLLSNAFKYTPQNQTIAIEIKKQEIDGQWFCLLSVTDTGQGIQPELRDRVFESFITGDTNPSFSTKIGIGLRIVKHTMDLHHGKVVLNSEPGQGSAFTLYLPFGKEHFSNHSLPVQQVKQVEKGTHKKILIIEDNSDMRTYICSLFNKKFTVIEAEDGKQGVEAAINHLPDMILSDIMMPVMDGFEMINLLKENTRTAHIPIIMLTAKAEDADVIRSMKLGVDDYVMKPFNPEVLKVKVENLISNREQLKRIYTKTLFQKPDNDQQPDEKEEFMQKIVSIVEANLTNPDFGVKILADRLNVSQPTLYRKIKHLSGLSIIEVIRSIRISKAASYILQKKYSIQEVSEMVGYNDVHTFRKHFSKQFGVSPSKYSY
ncbi:response regulator [Bacteroides sp. 519]|uniref:hybrid sensor histidine kinase/response regulator transcription factor n=1 Tax=Bacteroides sp. 519 TaxID=2302937 RepID=UPI0013CFEBA1|nr:response regulator [Bacteroides sp. 519]NDV60415.1 response regulator [Bacteroides sp. 519]